MANSIKYNTGTEANALRMGNFHMGVGDSSKGPTSTTGYYSAVNPPPGGYTIYVHNKNIGPSIQIASNDAELIRITNTIASTSYTTPSECFQYFNGQTDKMVVNQPFNFMVTDGLVLNVDAGNLSSYPTAGTTWNDLSGGGNNGTLINGPSFNSNGYFNFDGTDDFIDLGNQSLITDDFCIDLWYKLTANKEHYIFTTGYSNAGSILIFSDGIWLNSSSSDGRMPGAPGRTLNVWTNITVERTDGIAKWYRNGIYQYSLNYSGNISTNTNYSIGWAVPRNKASAYMEGEFYSAKVYNKGFTESEVQQNYYQGPIVTDGLVLAMDAGNLVSYENGSTTAYSLAGSLSGSLINGVGYNEGNGGAWEFDGVDDHIQVDADGVLGTFSDWSMGAWVRYETDQSTNWMIVVDQARYNQYYKNIMVWLHNSSNAKKIAMYDGSWQYSNSTIPPNTWTYIATTTEGQTAKMYINGELDATRTFNWNITTDVTRYLGIGGTNNNPSYRMNGNIAVVKIYDKTLTAEEVMQNYSAGKGRFSA